MTSTSQRPAAGRTEERRRAFQGGELYLLAALLVATLVAGGALALYFGNRTPGEGSVEAGFARDMSEHHAQAVQMAEIALRRSESEDIRTLATDMLFTQQNQIGQMQGWLASWGLPLTGPDATSMGWMGHPTEGLMPGMATPEEINELETAPPEQVDEQFLRLMIPHHEAAIPMSEAALQETDRPEVEQLASAIAASQESEISVMQDLLRSRGAEVEPSSESHDHSSSDHEHEGQ